MRSAILIFGVVLGSGIQVLAQASSTDVDQAVGSVLRSVIISKLPDPLVDYQRDWGRQNLVSIGITWKRQGIKIKPEITKRLSNDGHWHHFLVRAVDPAKNLQLKVHDIIKIDTAKVVFAVDIELPVACTYRQKIWTLGRCVFDSVIHAHCTTTLHLKCEAYCRQDKQPGMLMADPVFRLQTVEAHLDYRELVVDRIAGMGGKTAHYVGKSVHAIIQIVRPSLKKNLLAQADQAIIQVGDTKEIRLNITQLFSGK